jgi:SAM-dependent methyltransferase
MKLQYLDYYKQHSSLAGLRFAFDALCTRSRIRRLALLNRQRDYRRLVTRPDLRLLHHALNAELLNATLHWPDHDYGEGYFYQGLDAIGITGLRDTQARMRAMDLRNRLAGKRVLEIGCNCGFLSLSIAEVAAQVHAFDINPHLIAIARDTAQALGYRNVRFDVIAFEDFRAVEPFDAVLSFANHDTYDGNTRQSLADYFARCAELLRPDGLLLFESHPPAYEGERVEDAIRIIQQRFDVTERSVLDEGTHLDRGRTFLVASPHPASAEADCAATTHRPTHQQPQTFTEVRV